MKDSDHVRAIFFYPMFYDYTILVCNLFTPMQGVYLQSLIVISEIYNFELLPACAPAC
jgi:hypothetical protein